MLSRLFKINLSPGGPADNVVVSQYDSGYPVVLEVYDGTQKAVIPKGITAVMRGTRKDGLGFSYSCSVSGITVKAVIDTAMTALAGIASAEVVLMDENAVFGTANITVVVEKSPYPNGVIDAGVEECHNLEEQIRLTEQRVNQAVGQTMQNAEAAQEAADSIELSIERNGLHRHRVSSLNNTELAGGTIIEAVGTPAYVSDVSDYSDYEITETGWYIFARIMAEDGVTVTEQTSVAGAGWTATVGGDHVDVAVRFDVASMSKKVVVNWGETTDVFVFKATDLAVRNLDYRVTFYVYDADEFATWEYTPASDESYEGTTYYTVENGAYTAAPVIANNQIPEDTYYVHDYVLTADETFVSGTTYYTKSDSTYSEAEVTEGAQVTPSTYYVDTWALTTDKTFAGTAYYKKQNGVYAKAAVIAGDTVPTAYYEHSYVLTDDDTFAEGKTYYLLQDGSYSAAEVTAGEDVPENTYYEDSYTLTTDLVFVEGKTYYVKNSSAYSAAEVTAGEDVPDPSFVHNKVVIQGLVRNVTYRLNEIVDCPMEFILPEIEEDTHGAWFEIRCRHAGRYSMTLTPPSGDIKIASEHTQAETAGINMINLHYTVVDGVKIWRFMNTHSSIPA